MISGRTSAAVRIRSDGSGASTSMSAPFHRSTRTASMWMWSSTQGRIVSCAPGVEGVPGAGQVVAVVVEQAQQRLALPQRRGDAAAEDRRRGGDAVADEEEPGQDQLAVVVALAAVDVEQRPPGQHVGDRLRRARGRSRRPGPGSPAAAASNASSWRSAAQRRVVGSPHDQHGEQALLVSEDQREVAVELGLPGDRVGHRPGLGARVAAGRPGRRTPGRTVRRSRRAAPGRGWPARRARRRRSPDRPPSRTPSTTHAGGPAALVDAPTRRGRDAA